MGKDFCDTFANNSYKIDYSFYRLIRTKLALVMGHDYWLYTLGDTNDTFLRISHESDWFGKRYSTGFSIQYPNKTVSGLFDV